MTDRSQGSCMGMGRIAMPRLVRGAVGVLFWSAVMGGWGSGVLAGEYSATPEMVEESSASEEEAAPEAVEEKAPAPVAEVGVPSQGPPRGEVGEEEGAILQSRMSAFLERGERGETLFSAELGTVLPMMPENSGVVPRILPRIYYREGPDDVFGPGNVHYVIYGHETIVELAMSLGLGFNELYPPNRHVPVWVPEPGTVVRTPLQWILPRAITRSDIVINLPEMRLYHRLPDGSIESFSVGIGREGFETPLGKAVVTDKKKDPTWIVPESILKDDPTKPRIVKPGPDNPLGDRAIYLTLPGYRIHGTNQPYGLGRRVSHGCIRLYPEDIRHLFETVYPGDKVNFVDETAKAGWKGLDLYLEVHEPLKEEILAKLPVVATQAVQDALKRRGGERVWVDWDLVREVAHRSDGVVTKVGHVVKSEVAVDTLLEPRFTMDLIYPYAHVPWVDRSQVGKDLAVAENKPVFARRLVSEDMVDEPLRKSVGGKSARKELTPEAMERLGALEAEFEAEGGVATASPRYVPPGVGGGGAQGGAVTPTRDGSAMAPQAGGAEEAEPHAAPPPLKREGKPEADAAGERSGEAVAHQAGPGSEAAVEEVQVAAPELPPRRRPQVATP